MNHGLTRDYFISRFISACSDTRSDAEISESNPAEPPIAHAYDHPVIYPDAQKRLAKSRALPEVKRVQVAKMRQGFLNMSQAHKARLTTSKLSVLDSE